MHVWAKAWPPLAGFLPLQDMARLEAMNKDAKASAGPSPCAGINSVSETAWLSRWPDQQLQQDGPGVAVLA